MRTTLFTLVAAMVLTTTPASADPNATVQKVIDDLNLQIKNGNCTGPGNDACENARRYQEEVCKKTTCSDHTRSQLASLKATIAGLAGKVAKEVVKELEDKWGDTWDKIAQQGGDQCQQNINVLMSKKDTAETVAPQIVAAIKLCAERGKEITLRAMDVLQTGCGIHRGSNGDKTIIMCQDADEIEAKATLVRALADRDARLRLIDGQVKIVDSAMKMQQTAMENNKPIPALQIPQMPTQLVPPQPVPPPAPLVSIIPPAATAAPSSNTDEPGWCDRHKGWCVVVIAGSIVATGAAIGAGYAIWAENQGPTLVRP